MTKATYFFWGLTVLAFIGTVYLFQSVLLPFVLGGAIAYLLDPIVERLAKWGLSRGTSAFIILGLFFLVVAGILVLIVPILVREAGEFIESAPGYAKKIWEMAEPHIAWVQEKIGHKITSDEIQSVLEENASKAMQVGKGVLGGITSGGLALLDFFTTLLITPVAAYFLLKEWQNVTGWIYDILPRRSAATIKGLLGKIDGKIAGFIRGQSMVCLALGFIYAIALSIAGLNYGFVIGMATGVLSIIPFVGSAFGLVASVAVAFLQSGGDWPFVAIIAGIFFVGQFVEGNFITPKLIGDSVGLHPLWIIFALMAGGSLMGLVGMFLSVPLAASIGVVAVFAIEHYKKSLYYNDGLNGAGDVA